MAQTTQRLFFALWPDHSVRAALMREYDSLRDLPGLGRRVTPANLHITLHYLGNTSAEQKKCFIEQARRVSFQPFTLTLDRLGFFPRAAVSWIAPAKTPAALNNLHQALGDEIARCGFNSEQRAYHPHVTMARKIKLSHPPEPLNPLTWRVASFALVHSRSQPAGVEYHVIESFPARD